MKPIEICSALNTMFTATLTQVLRDAAAARARSVCSLSSLSSGISVKFMGLPDNEGRIGEGFLC
jgi:hypothetical protein